MADGSNDKKTVRLSEAERRKRLAELVLCRTKLSESERALLREVFPVILAMHQGDLRRYFQRRGLDEAEAKDGAQDVFVSFYRKIEATGFPDSIPAMLYSIAAGIFSNRIHGQKRDPVSVGLPSSGSEPPKTPPDLARGMDLKKVAPQMFWALTDVQREVVELCILEEISQADAAEVLGVALGTVKSRLMSAKRTMLELVEQLLPPSQQGAR